MAQLKMSGRIYNAMKKFAGGTRAAPQLADMFFYNGKVYATDSYAICRWTPADEYEILDNTTGEKIENFYFTPRMSKIPAGTTIYFDGTTLDIDRESQMVKDVDKLFDDKFKHPIDSIMGVNPDYLAAIATLGKAVRTDKCGSIGTTDIDWTHSVLHAHIDAGKNGYFDIIVMPRIHKTKAKKE